MSGAYLHHVYDYIYIDDETGQVKEQGKHSLYDLIGDAEPTLMPHSNDCECVVCKS